jgi:N-formylglutamate amidohydrolase
MPDAGYPPWAVLHIPHDSTVVPEDVRGQFLLGDAELQVELQRMTDHCTHALFAGRRGEGAVVRAPVSRLVVDVERFAEDAQEPMAKRGMGVIYEVTSDREPLRRPPTEAERGALMREWYSPHHQQLETAVARSVDQYGRCVVIDCHSFPGVALPYEEADPATLRPDICIGSDPFHTPSRLEDAFVRTFARNGWRVALNNPFAGALVPASRYHRDPRVMAVMVEVNRDLYLDPASFQPTAAFDRVADAVRRCCVDALAIIE